MDTRTQHPISAEPSNRFASQTFHFQQPPVVEEFPDLAPGLVMSTLRSPHVWGGMAWRRAFAGRGDQSAVARRMVGQILADSGRVDDARWVTAELVSNALRHSRSGQARGFFVVEVLLGADVARIVVYDLGGGSSPDFSRTPGSVPEAAEDGRGLAGVAELAVRVGVAGDAITGHAVWADLALASDGARASQNVDQDRLSPAAGTGAGAGGGCCPGVGAGPCWAEPASGDRLCGLPRQCARAAGGCSPGPFRGSAGGVLKEGADRVSAYGQEPWAQQALAALRRGWPDWAFLVVRYRWLAMRGKQVVVSATGPQELRHALPSIPPEPDPAKPVAESGLPVSGLVERGVFESGPVVPRLAELLNGAPGVSWARVGVWQPSVSASAPGAGVACGGDGAGVGLSGPLAAVAPSPGTLAAERSVTGTWAVPGADSARVAWWLGGWWPWGRRRDRSRPGWRAEAGARPAGRAGRVEGRRPRHRRARSRPLKVAASVAI